MSFPEQADAGWLVGSADGVGACGESGAVAVAVGSHHVGRGRGQEKGAQRGSRARVFALILRTEE